MTVYILIAVQFEERDLGRCHDECADYKRRGPMLLPKFSRPYRASDTSDRPVFRQ